MMRAKLVNIGWEMFRAEAVRYVLAAGALALALWIWRRWAEPRRIQNRRAMAADRRREMGYSLPTICIFGLTGVLLVCLEGAGLIRVDTVPPSLWQGLLQLALIIVLHDAYFYWMHRALHLRMLFRRAHAVHHKSRTPTPWAAYSFSPAEAVLEALYLPLFLLLITTSLPVLLFFLVHQIVRNVLGHCGHELMPPRFSRHWATRWHTTTTYHDLHHSEGRYNFGLYFTWWDRLLGTEHPAYHARFEAAAKPWRGS
ncbi:MAG TPA: sterol desaturase family protein [Allosphingosinicella sp.]|jgi:sterol desaturase/sphingolipid hydroxylase (fatty acid hydroxylase superfamily)|nr:sterol desaturase family protein [Allosphingosinicella sp.]